jgi:SpoIIAA-like
MIEILPQSTQTCLAVHFSGKVTGQEYQQFLDAIDERLKNNAKVNLVCELVDFDFYSDFESAKKDIKFGFGAYKHIHRAAFVGEKKWIEWFTRLIGPFTKAEEKYFSHDQREAAMNWACE